MTLSHGEAAPLARKEDSGDSARFLLEHRANLARERLALALEQLEYRGRKLVDFRGHLERHGTHLVIGGGLLAMGVGVVLAISHRRKRSYSYWQGRPRELARALGRTWQHPERLAAPPTRTPQNIFTLTIALTKLATALVTVRSPRSRGSVSREARDRVPPKLPAGDGDGASR